MANFIDLTGLTYCGKEAQEIFSKDIYDIDLRQYGITFMDGVKGKMKIYTGEIGDAWQLYTCPFTPAGSASLAEAFIEPAAIKVNQENCYDTFWNTFLVDQTEISLRGGIPQTFGDWYFGKLRQKMAKEYQEIFWQGDTAHTASTKVYLKTVDGIEKRSVLDFQFPHLVVGKHPRRVGKFLQALVKLLCTHTAFLSLLLQLAVVLQKACADKYRHQKNKKNDFHICYLLVYTLLQSIHAITLFGLITLRHIIFAKIRKKSDKHVVLHIKKHKNCLQCNGLRNFTNPKVLFFK